MTESTPTNDGADETTLTLEFNWENGVERGARRPDGVLEGMSIRFDGTNISTYAVGVALAQALISWIRDSVTEEFESNMEVVEFLSTLAGQDAGEVRRAMNHPFMKAYQESSSAMKAIEFIIRVSASKPSLGRADD